MFLASHLLRPIAATLLAGCALSLQAQQPLSLVAAQQLAVQQSRQLGAQDAAATALQHQAVAAGQLPDPVLRFGLDNLPLDGPDRFSLTQDFMTMRRVGLMQELPRPEKRQLKVERVQRDAQRQVVLRALAVAGIARDAGLAWIDSYYTRDSAGVLRRQLDETALQLQALDTAYGSGRATQADVFMARTVAAALQDRLRQVERQEAAARLMLGRWVGPKADGEVLLDAKPWLDAAAAARAVGDTEHMRLHHAVALLEADVRTAETELRQAQAGTRADWTVEASYSQRGPAWSNMLSVGVSIPLQLDRAQRQDRDVAAKVAVLAQARANLDDALLAHTAQVRVQQGDWASAVERVRRLEQELLPAAAQRSSAAQTAYGNGKLDLGAVFAARREALDARLQLLSLEWDTARQWLQWQYLVAAPADTPTSKEQP